MSHSGCAGAQEPTVVPHYADDGQPYGGPAEWPTALEGSAGAFPGVDYAALGAAVLPQFEDAETIASSRTRAIVVIHRVSYESEEVLLGAREAELLGLHTEARRVIGCCIFTGGQPPSGSSRSCVDMTQIVGGCHEMHGNRSCCM